MRFPPSSLSLRCLSFLVPTISVFALASACKSSSSSNGDDVNPQIMPAPGTDSDACAPTGGMACCDGDYEGTWTCGSDGKTVCQAGTSLTPVSECTLSPSVDGGGAGADAEPEASIDPPACAPPAGMDCCDGDEEGTWICGADGGTVCQDGTELTPIAFCTLPGPPDSGADASDAASASDATPD